MYKLLLVKISEKFEIRIFNEKYFVNYIFLRLISYNMFQFINNYK